MLTKHFHLIQVCILPFSSIERGNGSVDTYSVDITIIISCFWHFLTQFVQDCLSFHIPQNIWIFCWHFSATIQIHVWPSRGKAADAWSSPVSRASLLARLLHLLCDWIEAPEEEADTIHAPTAPQGHFGLISVEIMAACNCSGTSSCRFLGLLFHELVLSW